MLEWLTPTPPDVVAFTRPGGWTSFTNFGSSPVTMPAGTVIVSSSPVDGREVPAETTVWLQQGG